MGQFVNILNADGVDLVVRVDTLHILSVSLDDVDEIVDGSVFTTQNVSIVNLVFIQDPTNDFFIELMTEEMNKEAGINGYDVSRNSGVELHSADLLDCKVDFRWGAIETNTHFLEFSRKFPFLFLSFLSFQNHEQKVTGSGNGDNLVPKLLVTMGFHSQPSLPACHDHVHRLHLR